MQNITTDKRMRWDWTGKIIHVCFYMDYDKEQRSGK